MRHLILISLLLPISTLQAGDLASVRALLHQVVEKKTVAGGCVVILHHGNVIFEEGFGYADVASKRPFTINTPVIIASISKPLLGTAAFRLQEQGKINLSAPITDYLPEFSGRRLENGSPLDRPCSTIELFAHTSGIRHSEAKGGRPWFALWTAEKPLSEVVTRDAREFPFEAQPGTRYAYSGIGTDVAARVLEVATGQPRNELLVSAITVPLGMTQTGYRDAERLSRLEKMPTRYYHGKEGTILKSRARRVPSKNTYTSSGGAIISTAPDLIRWLMMIRNGGVHEGKRILLEQTINHMLAASPPSRKCKGGLSLLRQNKEGKATLVGHTGSSGTSCWIDFETDVIAVMLTQTRGSDIRPFRLELDERIRQAILAKLQDQ